MIKVLLVDDHDGFRNMTKLVVNDMEGIEVTGECTDGNQVLDFLNGNEVDVIIMDMNMKEMEGDEATELVKEHYPNVKVIAHTSNDDECCRRVMAEAGASDYLVKGIAGSEEMETAIKKANGEKETLKKPEILLGRTSRKQLEDYIKKNIPFYQWVNLMGHSEEQLRGVIERNR